MSIPKTAVIRSNRSRIVLLVSAIFAVASFMLTRHTIAADVCSVRAALAVSVQGDVGPAPGSNHVMGTCQLDTPLCAGDC
ncbi:hypothetical protein [Nitrosomonas sp.]|uniref:hypothetical protein n=1 Tax=Nitrosomonas sp. TaxID=42353 RepID=UPI002845001C|nr:hypothetical protein [Nitrosomonas sp.]MDR4513532.1 hypothetical protein [Nitrosomonas sp.]